MALSYKSRKRWAIVLLVIGLPAYIVACVTVLALFSRPPGILFELAVYVGLGVLWALPFKFIFKGIGQADPDRKNADE